VTLRKFSLGLLLSVALTLAVVAVSQAATPHSVPKQCGVPGGPSCPPLPPIVSPWQYSLYVNAIPPDPPLFYSLGDAVSWTEDVWAPGVQDCSATNTGTAEDPTQVAYWDGIQYRDWYVLTFTITYPNAAHANAGNPECGYTTSNKSQF
jgi:hypothetical protein